jgi:hypothetical protein
VEKFEEFIAAIQENFTPHAKVTHNNTITGKPGVGRQLTGLLNFGIYFSV